MISRHNTLEIRTPEGITFSLYLASPLLRFLAMVIDLIVVAAILMLLSTVLGLLNALSRDLARMFSVISYFVVWIGYAIALEWLWRGQTLGKRVLGLRVMDEQGLHLRFSQIFIRNLLRFVDKLPLFYVVGGVAALLFSKSQRLGDFAANTIVVRINRQEEPNIDEIMSDRDNSFHRFPHLEARLRQVLTSEETDLVVDAVMRRDEFDPIDRVRLFHEFAEFVQELVPFPEEVVADLSDEQYLRNVIGALYRRPGSAEKAKPKPLLADA